MSAKKTTLSYMQKRTLEEWLKANANSFDGRTIGEVSVQAEKALGFEISYANVKNLRALCGIEWRIGRKTSGESPKTTAATRARMLAYAISQLYEKLGEHVPDYLTSMISNAPAKEISELFKEQHIHDDRYVKRRKWKEIMGAE